MADPELPSLRARLKEAGFDADSLAMCLDEFKQDVERVSEHRRREMESAEGLLSYLAARDLADSVSEVLKYLPQ